MGYIDLHVHTNASDGTMFPEQVVAYGFSKHLDAIAITDHDTIDGIFLAQKAALDYDIEVIPGIEISCVYLEEEIHILGLYVDAEAPDFKEKMLKLKQVRSQRNLDMIQRFQEDGIMVTLSDLCDGNPSGASVTRAHFAKVLVEKGYAADTNRAFKKYLQYDGKYCHRKKTITPEYAMELLRDAHAFPVLAHPMRYHMGYQEIENLVVFLKGLGLKGIEAYHSSHNQHESGKLKEMAKRHGLLVTGGSDFHGSNKPDIDLGTGRGGMRISHLFLEDIKQAMGIRPKTAEK